MTGITDRLAAALADRYRIERELGQGGMATVYLAEDLKHRRTVAIKVLKPELATALGPERFLKEIETTANLRHPGILPLYDSGTVRVEFESPTPRVTELLFYVMPYVEGESLAARLRREKQLPIEDALQITREVAEALAAAHAQGVIHRDIKPENILLEKGHAILADFGIARAVDAVGAEKLTETGLAIGTPSYMSPEQSVGERDLDGRSDLYALGCVLFEMLAGEPPYSGPSAQAIIAKRFHAPVPRVSTLRESVSVGLEDIVTRLLAKSPVDRFASAESLVNALEEEARSPGEMARTRAARPARWSVTRRALIAGIVLLAAVAGYQGFARLRARGGALSRDLIAVVPFTVRGAPELSYLGEGMVDLMSAKLDGAGSLRVVNPRAVISLVNRDKIDIGDPAATRAVAQRLHAGRYVTGDVLEVGGRVRLTAYLHQTGEVDAPPTRATAEGAADGLFDALDSLASHLLGGSMSDSTARLQRLATTTSASLPALKEYLQGERLIRGGQYREAAEAYERAIVLDSAFALAYYRKSLVAEWIDAHDPRSSADKAFAYAARLSPRDRSLLSALRLRRSGRTHEAEQAYQVHLHTWPDEVEALVQTGEILFHDNPRRGRPMAEGIPVFQRALQLEPANANARIHLARLYALYGQMDSLAADIRHFERDAAANATIGADGRGEERLVEVQAIQAYATGDTARQREITGRLKGRPWYYWWLTAHAVSRFARDAAGAQAMLATYTDNEPLVFNLKANLYQVRGQHAEFRRLLEHVPGRRTAAWDLAEAFVWTSGSVPPDTARMEYVLARLKRADPAEIRRDNWIPAYEDLTVEFHRFERDYNVALLLINLGRVTEARPIISSLVATSPMPGLGNLQADAIRSLNAEILYRSGTPRQALTVLRTITYEAPHGATYHSFADGPRSRFLRAELELLQGDTTVAAGLYHGFDESWSPWDIYHRPIAYQRLGEIAEAQGRVADAITFYTRLVELWRDCDPALVPKRNEIRQRRDALLASQG